MKKVTESVFYVGVNDHNVDLFEGQYRVPQGMSYNSYVIMDEKIAVMDTVDAHFTHEWLDNVAEVLGSRKPDYLVVQRVQPYADSGHGIEVFKHFPHFGIKRIILHKKEPPCICSV